MRYIRLVFVLIPLIGACAADNSLQATLARMDSAAAKYKGMKGSISQLAYTKVIDARDVETGTIAARRPNPKDLRMLISLGPTNPKKVLVVPSKVEIYYPNMNVVEEYEIGKAAGLKDQMLLLSFGGTAKEVSNAYAVTAGPAETVGGQNATRLDLVPKDKKMLAQFPMVQLWISDDTGVMVQQKLIEASGDYRQATYTNIQLGNITDADVKLDVPRDAKRTNPAKR